MYYCNGPDTTSVHNLPFNSEVLIWHKSSNWTGLYHLLAVKDKICHVQLPSGLTSFKSTFVKPYFLFENTHNIKPDKPEALTKPNKLKVPLPILEVLQELTEPIKPAIKCGQRRL